ncbi:MAG: nicotinate phosphoribosyltransferase, partial [Rhodocyclaceae bacterium]|nr:nicotinate phosphoribosyltransferase [Rhodocyclaceae bacterium]
MLLTDLYQLTMLQAYARAGMNGTAVFELFVRRLPPTRNFLLAAGLEQALQFLQGARFTRDEIDWLAHCGRFDKSFVRDLADWRFGGDVWAVPEGTPVFGGEPLLRVVAPIAQAQIVETRLINLLQLPTLVASKAARCVLAAPRKLLIDFGLRRAHGAEAGLLSARAAYLAGFAGTATVAAGQAWDIPLFGTMAHSYVQACGDEKAAFRNYAEAFPAASAVLIDTYDSLAAARKVVELAREGVNIGAVRIDSG